MWNYSTVDFARYASMECGV
uniref:Uncharacterized protein n=1 Tax=Arundo donax TaxID=35708 RepID=A0A0A9BY84_ARUDO